MPLLFGSTAPTPDATSTVKGKLRLTNALGGTALNPVVVMVQAVGLSATPPSAGQALIATSPTAASWQDITAQTQRTFAYWAG